MSGVYYTYISRKQIGVIFRANKDGNLNLSQEVISLLYNNVAERRTFVNGNIGMEEMCRATKNAIDMIFAKNYEEAQKELGRGLGWLQTRCEGYKDINLTA